MTPNNADAYVNGRIKRSIVNPKFPLFLDGVCCCFKSSIIGVCDVKTTSKTQYNHSLVRYDTYGPSAYGYVCCGISDVLTNDGNTLYDRSLLNNLEWATLWHLINVFMHEFGLIDPINVSEQAVRETRQPQSSKHPQHFVLGLSGIKSVQIRQFASEYATRWDQDIVKSEKFASFMRDFAKAFEYLKRLPFYKSWRKNLNVIAFIDSNLDKVTARMRRRQEGRDYERSFWPFYTYFQVEMYKLLYGEENVIDLEDLRKMTSKNPVPLIASVIKQHLPQFKDVGFLSEKLNVLMGSEDHILAPNFSLPTVYPLDFTTINLYVFVHRFVGNVICKVIDCARANREQRDLGNAVETVVATNKVLVPYCFDLRLYKERLYKPYGDAVSFLAFVVKSVIIEYKP